MGRRDSGKHHIQRPYSLFQLAETRKLSTLERLALLVRPAFFFNTER